MNNNVIVQVLNLFLALQMNFAFPFVVGVEYYGNYISIIAIAIFVSRIAETGFDNVILTRYAGPPSLFLPALLRGVLLPKCLFAILAVLPVVFLSGHWEVLLLVTAQATSSFFSTWLYARKMTSQLILFLELAIVIFFGFLFLFYIFKIPYFAAVLLFSILNMIFGVLAVCLTLGAPNPSEKRLPKLKVSETVGFVIQSLNASFFSGGFVFFASLFISGERLGLFRIYTSAVQAATSLFPINIKTILTNLILINTNNEVIERARYLSGVFFISSSFLAIAPLMALVDNFPQFLGDGRNIMYISLCPFSYMFLMIMDKVMLAVIGPVKAGIYSFSILIFVCAFLMVPVYFSDFDDNKIEEIYFQSIGIGLLLQSIFVLATSRDFAISIAGLLSASFLLAFSFIDVFTLVPLMLSVFAVVGAQVFIFKPNVSDVLRR